MDKLYPFFPLSTGVTPGNTRSLVLAEIIYLAACAVLGVLRAVLSWIPLVGWLLGLVFSLLGIYCVIGMVLAALQYLRK